jgi:hypothetical protein
VSVLEEHRGTIEVLRLEPSDYGDLGERQWESGAYQRLDGFHRLHALKELTMSWNLLMGKPADPRYNGQDDWQYPQMRDVLPTQLEKMSLFLHSSMLATRYEDGNARLMISALPLNREHLRLKYVHLEYDLDDDYTILPFNVELIQQAYNGCGVQLEVQEPEYARCDGK